MARYAQYDESRKIAWEYCPRTGEALAYKTDDGGRYDKRDFCLYIQWHDNPTPDEVDERIRGWMDILR